MSLFSRLSEHFDHHLKDLVGKRSLAHRLRLASSGRPKRVLSFGESLSFYFFGIIWHTLIRFKDDHCAHRARALAYTTILSLVPMGALGFVFFRAFKLEGMLSRVQKSVLEHIVPDSASTVESLVTHIMAHTQNLAGVSVFGLVFLIFVFWMLISDIESHFNYIWRIKQRRPLLDKFKSWWSFLTLAPVFIFLSITLSSTVLQSESLGLFRYKIFHLFFPFFITCLSFVLAYRLLPYTRVSLRSAVMAGVAAGTLWEIVKLGFGMYLREYANFNQIYGSLATIPIFFISLYITWLIVLLGAELSFVSQNFERLINLRMKGQIEYREFYALLCVSALSERVLAKRGGMTTWDLSTEFGLSTDFVDAIMERLMHHGLVIRSQAETLAGGTPDGQSRYVLTQLPSQIYPADVLRAVCGVVYARPATDDRLVKEGIESEALQKQKELLGELLAEAYENQEDILRRRSFYELCQAVINLPQTS